VAAREDSAHLIYGWLPVSFRLAENWYGQTYFYGNSRLKVNILVLEPSKTGSRFPGTLKTFQVALWILLPPLHKKSVERKIHFLHFNPGPA